MARFLRQRATPAEAALWEALRHRRLAGLRFRRQHKVAGFIVDFFCPEKRLVVEVDGPIHETQSEADAARDALLRATGYQVLHATNDAVLENLTAVLKTIHTAPTPPLHPSRMERGPGVRKPDRWT